MVQIYPDCSLIPILNRIIAAGFNFYPLLDNITPSLTVPSALGSLTIVTGFGPTAVAAAEFTSSSVAAHQGTVLGPPIAITNGSGSSQTAYGYFITDTATTVLLGIAAFDAPVVVPNGGSITVTPTFGDLSQNS